MRLRLAVALLGVVCGSPPVAKAQETSISGNETVQPAIPALSRGNWELGVFGGGGVVASHSPDTEFLVVGGRLGRIMTAEHFPGWLRGNFEMAGELMPAYVVFTPRQDFLGGIPAKNIYGVSVKGIPAPPIIPEAYIMRWTTRCCVPSVSVVLVCLLTGISVSAQSNSQLPSFGVCKPVGERTTEVGCWILVDQPMGRIEQGQISWHLDVYPTRPEAEKAKGPRGTVIESLGKVWLLTIEKAGWRPTLAGERIAEIGPLPVHAGAQYSALFMEVIFNPGMTSAIHTHSGPEAWYNLAGETCLETPAGKLVGR
ncbi:MAG: hypothetical protein WBL63_24955 [Candidatus Acidiferrum sp.]